VVLEQGCIGLSRLAGRAINAVEAFVEVYEAAELRCDCAGCCKKVGRRGGVITFVWELVAAADLAVTAAFNQYCCFALSILNISSG
jgi:hypothetical protein